MSNKSREITLTIKKGPSWLDQVSRSRLRRGDRVNGNVGGSCVVKVPVEIVKANMKTMRS